MTPLLSSALLRAQSDDRLVALAAAGHDRAFEAIVERYRRPLMRYLRRLLSETLAEDVVQATFINAWSSLRTGTEVRELRPWLYRIAHNAAINALKKVGEAMEEVPESAGGFATEPAAELERRDEMLHALNSIAALPSRQRAALLAVAVDGRAHAEVAQELGLTDGAVRQLVHRARTTLRTAATACTPAPFLHALLASAGDSTVARVAEVAAGAGGAGAASVSLKAGAAAVLATGALVSGGPEVAKVVHPSEKPSTASAGAATPLSPSSGPGGGGPLTTPSVAPIAAPSGSADPAQTKQSGRTHRQRRKGRDADRSASAGSSSGRRKRAAADDRRGRRDGTVEQSGTQRSRGSAGASVSGGGGDDDAQRSTSTGHKQSGSGDGGGGGTDDVAGAKGGGAPAHDTSGGDTGGEGAGAGDDLVATPPVTEPADSGGDSSGKGDASQPPAQTQTVPPAMPTTPAETTAEPRTTTGGDSGGGGSSGG